MCGIIAAFNNDGKEVNQWVIDTYEEQCDRGQKGFGIVTIDENKMSKVLRATEPVKMMCDLHFNPSSMILMHHRTPTSTENYLDQTHPIKVSDGSLKYDYLVAHNGMISNDDELKEEHEKLGFVYSTEYSLTNGYKKFNDSESLAIEVARFIEEQTKEVGAKGSTAFVALQVSKDKENKGKVEKVFFGRNDSYVSPLNMSASKTKIRVSSEVEGDEVKPFILYSFAPNSKKMKLTKREIKFAKDVIIPTTTYSGNREFGYNTTARLPSGCYTMPAKSEDYVSKAMKDDMDGPKTDEEEAYEEIILDAETRINTAFDSFAEDLRNNHWADSADALKEIARALNDAETAAEVLAVGELAVNKGDTVNSLIEEI